MNMNREIVDYVAELAHLELTADERVRMQRDLNRILDYIDSLNELDTQKIAPMTQISLNGVSQAELRDDDLRPSLPHETALQNAPVTDGKFFKVPKVIER